MNKCNWCGFKAEYIQENKWPEEQDLEDILCGACLTILETPANELKNDQKVFLKIQLHLTDEQIKIWPGIVWESEEE